MKRIDLKIEKKEMILPAPGAGIVHASNLLLTADKTLLAACFGGPFEGSQQTRIYLQRRACGAERWSEPYVLQDALPLPHWNPVLYQRLDGSILLTYRVGENIHSWESFYALSADDGLSWSFKGLLVPEDPVNRASSRCHFLRSRAGLLLAPSSSEKEINRVFIDYSRDDGLTWTRTAPLGISLAAETAIDRDHRRIQVSEQSYANRGVIQPTLWEDRQGVVHMYTRSSESAIYHAQSFDGGVTWTALRATSLPNNNSGIDLLNPGSDELILACNPVASNWGPRTPLALLFSPDNGAHWERALNVETADGEYAYPSLIAGEATDEILLSYTHNRRHIALLTLRFTIG